MLSGQYVCKQLEIKIDCTAPDACKKHLPACNNVLVTDILCVLQCALTVNACTCGEGLYRGLSRECIPVSLCPGMYKFNLNKSINFIEIQHISLKSSLCIQSSIKLKLGVPNFCSIME